MGRSFDAVIIGGSAAGVSAALTCRRHYPDKSVFLIRKDEHAVVPCGIPYVFGTVGSPDKNLIPDAILTKNNIEFTVNEVKEIDRASHTITMLDGEKVKYGKLILATGSLPAAPPIPGVDKEYVFTARKEVPYLTKMLDALDTASNLVIVGGGFIGVEFADECKKRRPDINITIVEMMSHCLMLTYDEEFCVDAEDILKREGIQILGSEKVEAFLGGDKVERVRLSSGKELPADMVILGIGARANVELAKAAGLELGPTGGIQVNRYMQTSDEDIFACGDCADKVSFFDGKPCSLKLASIATMEARIAGANLFGARRANMGVVGVFSTKLGATAFAATGLTETAAKKMGYDVVVGVSESVNRHPGGMPGAANLKVKLVFEKGTGVLLGGQITGAESGGELINAVSACVYHKMTADDIATFQMGTHPALTASPIAYQLVNAAEMAIMGMKQAQKAS